MAKKPKDDKATAGIKKDFGTSADLVKTYLPTAPLAHYADPYAADDANLLHERSAFASPLTSFYSPDELAGNKAKIYGQVGHGIDQGQADAEFGRISGLTKQNPAFAGNISADQMGILNRLNDQSQTAGTNSKDIEDIIQRFKSGLDGYTAAENTAFREAGMRGINATGAQQHYDAQRNIARNGVRGAAANAAYAGIDRDTAQQGREFEQDLFLKNADEKQNRLKTYADFTRTNDDTNYARKDKAFGDFRDYQKNIEDTAYGRGQTAIQSWQDALRQSQGHAFDVGQFNLGQDDKTQARDVGGLMGIMGLLGTRRSDERQNKIIGG